MEQLGANSYADSQVALWSATMSKEVVISNKVSRMLMTSNRNFEWR